MRPLRLQWSRAFSLLCEVALKALLDSLDVKVGLEIKARKNGHGRNNFACNADFQPFQTQNTMKTMDGSLMGGNME